MIKDRDFLKESLVVIPCFLLGVFVFGTLADKFLGSEEKAQKARDAGADM